ncbi:TRAF3-interacting protein 1 [Bulinus truncatus]|nr:TRAF3-interacting protein 1 [Bulinus truncatus]
MDPKISKKTQDTLGKIIKKPPLTEKLLGKPPFRFLHDVTTSVIKTTGFMQGLFTEEEMNSENVKEKDGKIAFLQKAMDMVSAVTGKTLSAKPIKIVAGHEPEKTNEFLQALAEAINKNVDNDEYVRRVLKVDKKEEKKEKPKERSEKKREVEDTKERSEINGKDREKSRDREKEKPPDKERDRHKDREKDSKSRDKSKESREKEERHKEKPREHRSKDERQREKEERSKEKEEKTKEKEEKQKDREDRQRETSKKEHVKETEKDNVEINADISEQKDKQKPVSLQRPTSAKGSRRRREEDEEFQKPVASTEGNIGDGDLPPQVVAARHLNRPSSARPAPPRPKQDIMESEPAMRLGSGQPTNLIVDNDEDEDEHFIVEETAAPLVEPDFATVIQPEGDDTEHGALVKKMLESKKDLESGNKSQSGAGKKTEIERPSVSDAQRRKQREMVQKEVDKLRGSIQSLTRSANPLGKVMDYVQEDLDSMQQELEKWREENAQHALELKREMNVTDRAVEPLKQQLSELERAIKDQLDQIAATKANIIKNDQKIQKMLHGLSSS